MEPSRQSVTSVIQALQQLDGLTAKQAMIREAAADVPHFKRYLQAVYDPFQLYHFRAPGDEPLVPPDPDSQVADLLQICGSLARKVDVHAKRAGLVEDLLRSPVHGWLFWHILKRDIRAGVGVKTINKAVPKLIPVFDCALASEGFKAIDNVIPTDTTLTFPLVAEPKLDGLRVLFVIDGPNCAAFSRQGKLLDFPGLCEQARQYAKVLPCGDAVVLDSEVMAASYQDTMSRQDGDDTGLSAYVFDWLPLDTFRHQRESEPYRVRRAALLAQAPEAGSRVRPIATSAVCNVFSDVVQALTASISNGFEGLILKQPDTPYEFKRSKAWQKVKPFYSVEAEVVGVEPGKGKYAGKLGALRVRGSLHPAHPALAGPAWSDVDETPFEAKVGSGFTDEDRERLNTSATIGHTVEVLFQDVTRAKKRGAVPSLRFPSFMRIRADK